MFYMYFNLNSKTYYCAFYFSFIICYMSQYYIISYRIVLNYTRLYNIRIYQIRLFCIVSSCVLFYQFMVCVLNFYISIVLCIEKMYIICYDHYTYHMRHGTLVYMCIWTMFKFITFLYKSVSFFPAALVVPLTHVFQWANWVSSSFALRFKRMQNRLSHFEPIPPQDTSPNRVQLHPAHSYSNFQAKLLR